MTDHVGNRQNERLTTTFGNSICQMKNSVVFKEKVKSKKKRQRKGREGKEKREKKTEKATAGACWHMSE